MWRCRLQLGKQNGLNIKIIKECWIWENVEWNGSVLFQSTIHETDLSGGKGSWKTLEYLVVWQRFELDNSQVQFRSFKPQRTFSTMKIEVGPSEFYFTKVPIYQTARLHNRHDHYVNIHRCESLKTRRTLIALHS
jgi:hypothetical protein